MNLFGSNMYRFLLAPTWSGIALNLRNLNPANFIQAYY